MKSSRRTSIAPERLISYFQKINHAFAQNHLLKLNGEFSLHGIAEIRARYDGLVASGMDKHVEWLETEDDVVRKAPHLRNSDIKVSYILPDSL